MKNYLATILTAAILLRAESSFGQVVFSQPVSVGNSNNAFPIMYTAEAQGTSKQVADIAGRNAISSARRTVGMTCFVQTNGIVYRLVNGISDSNWIPDLSFGAGIGYNPATRTASSSAFAFASVISYGADPTGVTNSDAAFALALTNSAVYVPAGLYRVTNTIAINSGTYMFGDGPASVLTLDTNYTGWCLSNAPGTAPVIQGLTVESFDGSVNWTNFGSPLPPIPAPGNRNGILLNGIGEAKLINVNVHNWTGYGVYVTGDSNPTNRLNSWVMQTCSLTNNNVAIECDTNNQSEYGRIIGCLIRYDWTGIDIRSANITVGENQIHDVNIGIRNRPDNGRSHNEIVNNMINHHAVSLWLNHCASGLLIQGNNILGGGSILIDVGTTPWTVAPNNDSQGVVIQNNLIEIGGYIGDWSSSSNVFRYNVFSTNSSVNVHVVNPPDAFGVFGCTNDFDEGNIKLGFGPVWMNPYNYTNPPRQWIAANQQYGVNPTNIAGGTAGQALLSAGGYGYWGAGGGGGGQVGATTNEVWASISQFGGAAGATNDVAFSNALYSLVDGVNTNSANSADLFCPPGVYNFNSLPIDRGGGAGNFTMFAIPHKTPSISYAGSHSYLRIHGNAKPMYYSGTGPAGPNANEGTVFMIWTTNQGYFLESTSITNNGSGNGTSVEFENITFRVQTNSALVILGLKQFASYGIDHVNFDHPWAPDNSFNKPVAGSGPFEGPQYNLDVGHCYDVLCEGFDRGPWFGEHNTVNDLSIVACAQGLMLGKANLPNLFGRVLIQNCPTNITVLESTFNKFQQVVIEKNAITTSTGAWMSNWWDLVTYSGANLTIDNSFIQNDQNLSDGTFRYLSTDPGIKIVNLRDPLGTVSYATTSTLYLRAPHHSFYHNGTFGYSVLASRGDPTAPVVLQNGDGVDGGLFYGYDGTGYTLGAAWGGLVDGSPSAGSMPSDFAVFTGPGGNTTNQFRIDPNGNVYIVGSLTATNGFFQGTNGASLTLNAGQAYATNLTADITLAAFTGVPPARLWSIYLWSTNASGSDHKITFPAGCRGQPGQSLPPAFYVTNNACAEMQVNGWGNTATNVNWVPH